MIFNYNKTFGGKGSRLIFPFLEAVQKEFIKRLFRYYKYTLTIDGEVDYDPIYGEQRLKSFVTPAIDAICNSFFVQEVEVERIIKEGKIVKAKNGKIDYWCRYQSQCDLTILLELKHSWMQIKDDLTYRLHSWARKRHFAAIDQIKNIDKGWMLGGALYGVSLTILPMYYKHLKRTNGNSGMKLPTSALKKIVDSVLDKESAHAAGICKVPALFNFLVETDENNPKFKYESYPGIAFFGIFVKYRGSNNPIDIDMHKR